MNPYEIIRALRENADWCGANKYEIPLCMGDNQREAANLIESLQAQLADYHHMSELVGGKMEENQRLRRINENLQSQLADSQRRGRAAVEDIEHAARYNCGICGVCAHYAKFWKDGGCNLENNGEPCKWQWRGPQEAGEGEAK